jgi:hypothetical protein
MNVSLSSAARSWSFAWNGIMASASASQAPMTTQRERGPAAYPETRLSISAGHYRNSASGRDQGVAGGAGGGGGV